MDETEYKPTWRYYLAVWGTLTILGGIQGWFTADSIRTVMHWLGH